MVRSISALLLLCAVSMAEDSDYLQVSAVDTPSEKLFLQFQPGMIHLSSGTHFHWEAGLLTRLNPSMNGLGLGLRYSNSDHLSLKSKSSEFDQVSISSVDALANWSFAQSHSLSSELEYGAGYGMTTALSAAGEALQKSYLNQELSLLGLWHWKSKWALSLKLGYKQALFVGQDSLSAQDLSGAILQMGIRWQP